MAVIHLIKIAAILDVTLCSLEESAASFFRVQEASALTMQEAGLSETLIPVYQTTRGYIPFTIILIFTAMIISYLNDISAVTLLI